MKRMRLFVAFVVFGALYSCQSNVDAYEGQKKEHFGEDYYTTVTFENGVKVDEVSLNDATIDMDTFETSTVIADKTYKSKFKYLVAVSKYDEPIELIISGTGISPVGTPQEMTSGEFGVGVVGCMSIGNIFSGNSVECVKRLIVRAQFDCCFSTTPSVDCWIGCPLNPDDNWPSSDPF